MTLSRSTPMRRTAFTRPAPTEAHFAAKPRTCKHCKVKFTPVRAGQLVHLDCAAPYVQAQNAKKRAAAVAKDKAETKQKLAGMKRLPDLIKDAQVAFNAFIRARDAGKPCICCGKPMSPDQPGGSVDAGHFRSRGAAPQLRFNENNCFAQRKGCNRVGGATYGQFREGVIARVGLAAVEALEADNAAHKWARDELIAIRATYVQKLKTLNAAPATAAYE